MATPAAGPSRQQTELNQAIVEKWIKETSINVLTTITKDLMSSMQTHEPVKDLAGKKINKDLDTTLNSDAKTKMVFGKLFDAVVTLCGQPPSNTIILPFLGIINEMTGNKDASRLFLGTYVLNETQGLVKKLQAEQPTAMSWDDFWKTAATATSPTEGKTQ